MLPVAYNPYLVALSIVFAVASSYAALDLAERASASSGRPRRGWLIAGSLVMAFGIWGTHFVGMMAFELPVPIAYHITELLLSMLVALGASSCALYLSSRSTLGFWSLVGGSLLMGPAIAGVHYLGVAALRADADVSYNATLVAASITIAVAASFAALWHVRRFRGQPTQKGEMAKVGSAVVMGAAIAGLHYTAMAAAHFTATPHSVQTHNDVLVGGSGLSALVAFARAMILVIALIASAKHRRISVKLVEATRASEAMVRSHERFLRQIIDANPSLVFVKDWDGKFVLANRALADMYGSTVDDLVGKTDADFNKNDDEVRAFLADDRTVMTGQIPKRISEEPVTNSLGQTRWFQTVKIPLVTTSESIRQVLGVATDITDRKLLEDQLRQAQKMDALGQLTGGIAHDLNNVLTVILANTDLMAPHITREHSEIAGDFQDLQSAASRGAEMVRKLLAFSRRETLRLKPLMMDTFGNDFSNTVRRLLPATIEIRLTMEERLPAIVADEGAVHQMLLNLATNARDAMPNGGLLVIDMASQVADNEWCVTHGWDTAGKYLCVTVTDTGSGMDAAIRDKIFEPFFTTKKQGEGTGLGLPMVYGLIRQHKGFIGVYSEIGQGTAIRLYFPVCTESVGAPEPAVVRPMRGGTETILIADDEESIRRSTTRVLERHGYHVITVSNGEEALRIISERGEEINLVISDVVMPKMGGKELHANLTRGGFNIPFMFTSGYAAREVRESVELDANIPFLHKPWAMSDLLQKVREVVEKTSTQCA